MGRLNFSLSLDVNFIRAVINGIENVQKSLYLKEKLKAPQKS